MERWRYRQDLQNRLKDPGRYKITGRIKKEDGILVSQKILLTWLIESEDIFRQIEKYITPEDFSEGLFRASGRTFI